MKAFLLILFYFASSVHGIPSCRRELLKYANNNANCMNNAIVVQKLINKVISKKLIDFEQFADVIRTSCATANSSHCYNEMMNPVHRRCNTIPALQEIRNSYKLVIVFNEYVCQDNGTVYLNFLRDGGAQCYKNADKKRCYEDAKANAWVSPFGVTSFLDTHICGVLEADSSCLYEYDNCENLNVKNVYTQILQSMKQKYNCN